MAQKTEELYNILIAEKENFTSLDTLAVPVTETGKTQAQQLVKDLNTESAVGVWREIFWVFAYLARTIQVLWDRVKLELTELADTAQPGTAQWLEQQSLNYRDTYPVTIDSNYRARYSDEAIADLEKAIVTAASVKDEYGVATLKVAKGAAGAYGPLSVEELERFRSYVNVIRFAGQTISAVSRASDQLLLNVSVYFDGMLDETETSDQVKAAVRAYLSNLGFDGVVKVSGVVDAIQSVAGVKDVLINSIQAKTAMGSYGSVTRVYTTYSGYIKLDDTSVFTLVGQ